MKTLKRPVTGRGAWLIVLCFFFVAILSATKDIRSYARLNLAYTWLNWDLADGTPPDKALARLNASATDISTAGSARYGVALAHQSAGRYAEAVEAWSHVEQAPEYLEAWAILAERSSRLEDAEKWLFVLANLEPTNGDNWYELARISALSGDSTAKDYYNRAMTAPLRENVGVSNVLTRLGELEKLAENPDWEHVLVLFDKAIEENAYVDRRDYIVSRMGRAEALERLGRLRESLDEYRRIIHENPGVYWAYVHGGRLIWYVEDDAETAISYLQRAIQLDKKPKWAYLTLGQIYAQTGAIDLAIDQFQKTLTIDPNDEHARQQLDTLLNNNEN